MESVSQQLCRMASYKTPRIFGVEMADTLIMPFATYQYLLNTVWSRFSQVAALMLRLGVKTPMDEIKVMYDRHLIARRYAHELRDLQVTQLSASIQLSKHFC